MGSFFFKTIFFLMACVILYIIAKQLIDTNSVIPLPGFATTTISAVKTSSSTDNLDVNHNNIISTDLSISISTSTADSSVMTEAVRKLSLLNVISLQTPTNTINTLVADNSTTRQQGLSDVKGLPKKSGMLFVFETPGKYGFWMKDMHFPLDMVWIDSNKVVVNITKNIDPSTYPTVFSPPSDISYVLEVNAGFAEKLGIEKGMPLVFTLPTAI